MAFQVTIENPAEIAGLTAERARKALSERSELLHKVFEEAGPNVDPSTVKIVEMKDGVALAAYIRNLNDELTKIGTRVSEFDELDKIQKANGERREYSKGHPKDPAPFAPRGEGEKRPVFKSLGQLFVESGALKAAREHQNGSFEIAEADAKGFLEQKAIFSTSAGWAPQAVPLGRFVPDEQRGIEVTDILPSFPTGASSITYMEETTFTNAAAERAEGGAYAEAALALTERTATIRSLGVSLPVTDEQLEDVEGIRAYLDQRLGFMVRQRLDGQIVAGNGTPPNLTGTLNVSGILTQAKGGDPTPDAIYKAITQCQVTGMAMPNVVIAHPTDWQAVRLLRTSDGIYIWGSPSEAGPDRIWGLPVVKAIGMTENTMIVGDYARFAGLYVRRGLELQTGYVNDDFTDGRITIRAGMRVAVVHFRPAAFCTVTGV